LICFSNLEVRYIKNLFFVQQKCNINDELFDKFIKEAENSLDLECMSEDGLCVKGQQHGNFGKESFYPIDKGGISVGFG